MRHLVIAAAALPLILVSGPEGLSPKQAEACGAKVSVKGAKIARMRRLSNSSARQPIAAGPIGVSGRAAVNVGGDAGDRSPSASGGGETAARTPPRKRPKADPVARNETPKEEPAATNPDLGRKTEEPTPKEDPPLAEPAPTPPAEKAPKGKFASHYFFGNASSSLTSQSTKKLKATARWLKANPDKSVVVEGHASTNGNHNANRNLSEKRAEAVKAQLVELGVDESRISVEAFGSDRPEFEPGASAKNRRVVIIAK